MVAVAGLLLLPTCGGNKSGHHRRRNLHNCTQRTDRTCCILHYQFRHYSELDGSRGGRKLHRNRIHGLREWGIHRHTDIDNFQRDQFESGDDLQLYCRGERLGWAFSSKLGGFCDHSGDLHDHNHRSRHGCKCDDANCFHNGSGELISGTGTFSFRERLKFLFLPCQFGTMRRSSLRFSLAHSEKLYRMVRKACRLTGIWNSLRRDRAAFAPMEESKVVSSRPFMVNFRHVLRPLFVLSLLFLCFRCCFRSAGSVYTFGSAAPAVLCRSRRFCNFEPHSHSALLRVHGQR